MYNLFTSIYEGHFSVSKPPEFEIIKRTYQKEIEKIVDYYQTRVFAVKGNHLLCRLLMMSSVPVDYEIDRFMDVVYARAPFIAKHFRFTSDKEYGVFHDGVFYGPGNKELIFYNEDYFNPYEAVTNWKNLKPIKVLSHQISDLTLLLPDGRSGSTGQGFCSISINVPMLLVMYRGFLLEQTGKTSSDEENTNSLLGVNHFVNMYVLSGMLESHIDIVILNRLSNLLKEEDMSIPLRKYVFPVADYSNRVDHCLMEVIKRLKNAKMNYYGVLQNIPSIFHENMQESLIMPEFSRTRQVWWALNMSRLEVMSLLIDLCGENGVDTNGTLINELKKMCNYLTRENMLKTLLPPLTYLEISTLIESILSL